MRNKKISPFYLVLLAGTLALGVFLVHHFVTQKDETKAQTTTTAKVAKKAAKVTQTTSKKTTLDPATMRKPIDWKKSSETKPYPDLTKVNNFWIKVDLKKNRTYLMSDNKVIYTMYSSGGAYHLDKKTGKQVSDTPTGTFYIEPERGDSFFNSSLNEGANNWISWKDHGVYLFHSVPTDGSGNYNVTEAKKLGKEAASHGCIRLSVPDSKWMSQNLQTGTKVVVKG